MCPTWLGRGLVTMRRTGTEKGFTTGCFRWNGAGPDRPCVTRALSWNAELLIPRIGGMLEPFMCKDQPSLCSRLRVSTASTRRAKQQPKKHAKSTAERQIERNRGVAVA